MNDLIERHAAIDILDAYQVMVENGDENPYAWARLRMSELPSAQPKVRTQMSSADCISRQDAIEAVYKNDRYTTIKQRLDALPPAQPEIIRCKDCKHRYVEDMIWRCPFGLMGGENFFCGYGSL